MYRALLVKQAIIDGKQLIDRLRRQGFDVSAAIWYHDQESTRWRLVIVSPSADVSGISAYREVQNALARKGSSTLTLDEISVVSPSSSDFKQFRQWLQGARVPIWLHHRSEMFGGKTLTCINCNPHPREPWESNLDSSRPSGASKAPYY